MLPHLILILVLRYGLYSHFTCIATEAWGDYDLSLASHTANGQAR